MKKNLLLLATMAMAGTMSAQINMIQHEADGMPAVLELNAATAASTVQMRKAAPEGEAKQYTMTCMAAGAAQYSYLIEIIESDDKLYVSNLFGYYIPDSAIDTWAEGTIDSEAGTVTFAPQHVGNYSGYDITLGGYAAEPTDLVFTIGEDGIYSNNTQYVTAFAYQGETLLGLLMYSFNVTLAPGDVTPKPLELPEGVEPQQYVYHYHDLYNAEYTKVSQVAISGSDVYFSGLAPQLGECWIHGTIEDNIVSIDLGQYIGQTSYYQCYTGAYSFAHDFTGAAATTEYKLVYDPATGKFTSYETEDTLWALMQVTANGANYSYNFTFTILPLEEAKAGVPADPTEVKLSGNTTSESMYFIIFKSSLLNEEEQYFEPENLYYRLYVDEDAYTFAADEYQSIDEDTDLIPWGLNDAVDFYMVRDVAYVNLHENLFETLGIQIVYLNEGREYCSNIINCDLEGNITITEVENDMPVAIQSMMNKATDGIMFNLSGQRTNARQGIVIKDGKASFIK